MTTTAPRMRQLVDWRAALWAGLISGLLFLLINLLVVPLVVGGNARTMLRFFASLVMGEGVLVGESLTPVAIVVGLLTHFVLSVLYALLIAYIIHRGGVISGIIGGALLGLALYSINFYTFTYFFPWFFAMRNWVFVVAHGVFGALAGALYEALEVEIFVPEEEL